jgi:hypothetical protein
MNDSTVSTLSPYELRFKSLIASGLSYAFPCDADGQVNMDELTDVLRESYLYARTVIGREYARPEVACANAPGDAKPAPLHLSQTP